MGLRAGGILKDARAWGMAAALATSPFGAAVARSAEVAECYDAVVYARALRQTPTPYKECIDENGDVCIVLSWPWILDLEIQRVVTGRAPLGRVTALAVLHSEMRRDLAAHWLRRNDLGGFNVLRFGTENEPKRCLRGTAPARAYFDPGEGRTLRKVAREMERSDE